MLYSLRKSLIAAGFLTALAVPPVHAVSPDELFEVLQRIESLENEIRFLRGENEQLRYDIEDVKNTQKSTFIRIDDRMDDLFRSINSSSSNSVAPPLAPLASVSPPPVLTTPVEKSVTPASVVTKSPAAPALVESKTEVKPVVAQAAKPASAKVPAAADKVVPVSLSVPASSAEQIAYNAALSKMQSQPAAAIAQFRGFLKKHPQSPLAPSAQYWLGEMMYSSRNYQGAIDEFVTVLQNYGTSPKAPDAAVKLGLSFYEMKNWVYARRTLEDVMRNYPQTSAANTAQMRLAKMKADNLY